MQNKNLSDIERKIRLSLQENQKSVQIKKNEHSIEHSENTETPLSSSDPENSVQIEHFEHSVYSVPEFPIDIFPIEIQKLINEAYSTLNFPKDFTASSILIAASVAIGNSRSVVVKKKWEMTAILYTILVGLPGSCKTHPIKLVFAPVRNIESARHKIFMEKLKEHNALPPDEKQSAYKPSYQQIILNDATPEALCLALKNNQRGLIYHRDEIIAWIKDFTSYNSSGAAEQLWLSIYSGEPISVNRKTSENLRIESPFISVIGTIQPDVLFNMIDSKENNGFIDRILFSFPDHFPLEQLNDNEISDNTINEYNTIISNLFLLEQNILNDKVVPKQMTFSIEGWKHIKQLFDLWSTYQNSEDEDQKRYLGIFNKMKSNIPRIALILQCIDDVTAGNISTQISERNTVNAIKVGEYFIANAKKIMNRNNLIDDTDKVAACKTLSKSGMSVTEISRALNIARGTVYKYLKT